MGVPVPPGLSLEQYLACQKFGLAVFGELLLDPEPSHNGRHGHNCPTCSRVLVERERAIKRIKQPWELRGAA